MTQPMTITGLTSAPESRTKPISSRGGLRFLYRLGQGGMAEVHVAACNGPSPEPTLVVVKRMHQQHLDDPATVRMFQDEARLALRLTHPNIVRTERLGMFDGRHGIVMEYLEGQPFHLLMKRAYEIEATLSLDVIVQIAIAALDGLHYAHELKDGGGAPLRIVHRDVSPQNLLITYDGAVKLLDFGIAKNALADARTRTGLLKGKISYMAPEQARGEELDRRADLWSLGVMLWEAVTGSRLFRGSNEAATLNMTLTEQVAAPSMRRPDLPLELERILMRALERDPKQRYATAADMRDELEAWLSTRELTPGSSVSMVMHRLFGAELRAQREQIEERLQAAPDPFGESGLTMVAPLFGASPGTASGLRATQISTVTDLMEELTRQRRTTTRLLSGLLGVVAAAALVGLYLLHTSALNTPIASGPPAATPTPQVSLAAAAVAAPVVTVAKLEPPESAAVKPTSKAAPRAVSAAAAAPQLRRALKPARPALADGESARAVPQPSPASETGFLNLDTSPWSMVSAGGRVLGQTPLVGVQLPAGTHVLALSNPELGLKTTYQVTISAGRTTARRVGLE